MRFTLATTLVFLATATAGFSSEKTEMAPADAKAAHKDNKAVHHHGKTHHGKKHQGHMHHGDTKAHEHKDADHSKKDEAMKAHDGAKVEKSAQHKEMNPSDQGKSPLAAAKSVLDTSNNFKGDFSRNS